MFPRSATLILVALTAGCGGAPRSEAPSAVVVEPPGPPEPRASAAPADTTLRLSWSVNKLLPDPADARLEVTLRVNDRRVVLGEIDATSDDEEESGNARSCEVLTLAQSPSQVPSDREATGTQGSIFRCGGTPAYNFYTVVLRDGALDVTFTHGVDTEPEQERTRDVKRIPVTGTSLRVETFAPVD